MPALGADMTEGTVSRWLVKPGDTVTKGSVVAEVETDKATIEAEIFESGTVEKLLVPEGERVPVGTPLALLRTAGDGATAAAPAAAPALAPAPAPASAPASAPAQPAVAATAVAAERPHIEASPLARRMAALHHVDLAALQGHGPGGAITRADVQAVIDHETAPADTTAPVTTPSPPPPPAAPSVRPTAPATPATTDRLALMQRRTGELMARSKREIPHYYVDLHIDMSRALAWLEERNLERSLADRLVSAVLLLRATALAAARVPEVNGFFTDGEFHPAEGVHLGVAIAVRGGGLIAPALHDCEAKGLDELMHDLRGLVERARNGILRSSEMTDPTLTVSNLGDQGVDSVYGVIYPPQVALVGFGRIVERAWAVDGMVGARRVVHATLAADHRVSDGHRGGRFLTTIDGLLQEPEKL